MSVPTLRTAFLVVALSLVVGATPALAQEPSLEIMGGRAAQDGAAEVRLRVVCDPKLQTLEANISVSQDAVSALSGIAGVRCTGHPRLVRAVVRPLDGATGGFEAGSAHVSAFLLLLDPATGMTVQAQDAEAVELR